MYTALMVKSTLTVVHADRASVAGTSVCTHLQHEVLLFTLMLNILGKGERERTSL